MGEHFNSTTEAVSTLKDLLKEKSNDPEVSQFLSLLSTESPYSALKKLSQSRQGDNFVPGIMPLFILFLTKTGTDNFLIWF